MEVSLNLSFLPTAEIGMIDLLTEACFTDEGREAVSINICGVTVPLKVTQMSRTNDFPYPNSMSLDLIGHHPNKNE